MRVWDGFVRGYHWAQLALLAALWWTAEQGQIELHMAFGLIFGCLLASRLLWALWGSSNARFTSLLRSPRELLHQLRCGYQNEPRHSPLGSYMVLLLWLVLALQLVSGLYSQDDLFNLGPLAESVDEMSSLILTDFHRFNQWLIWSLAAVHIAAVLIFMLKGQPLLGAMVHGRRQQRAGEAPKLAHGAFGLLGFALLLALTASAFGEWLAPLWL